MEVWGPNRNGHSVQALKSRIRHLIVKGLRALVTYMHTSYGKHILKGTVLVLVGLLVAQAGYNVGLRKPPRIEYASSYMDFGKVIPGQRVSHSFLLENRGGRPLRLRKTRSSCSCARATVSTQSLEPGERGEMVVIWDTPSHGGSVRRTVLLETNDPSQPVVSFALLAEVESLAELYPSYIDFGLVEPNDLPQSRTVTVLLPNDANKDLRVWAPNRPDWLGIDLLHIDNLVRRLVVTLNCSVPCGFLADSLSIALDKSGKAAMSIPVLGEVIGDIEAVPPSFSLGLLEEGERRSCEVVVRPSTPETMRLHSIQVSENLNDCTNISVGRQGDELQLTCKVVAPPLKEERKAKCTMKGYIVVNMEPRNLAGESDARSEQTSCLAAQRTLQIPVFLSVRPGEGGTPQ